VKRAALCALLALGALATAPAPAALGLDFGLSQFDVFYGAQGGGAALEAGSHPASMSTTMEFNHTGEGAAALLGGEVKDLTVTLPPGMLANPTAAPPCSDADFLARAEACPANTKVGEVTIELADPIAGTSIETSPVYNLAPPPGSAARLGFAASGIVPVVIDGGIEPGPPYRVIARLRNTSQALKVLGAELTLFGAAPGGVAFLTLPGSCAGPQPTSYEALSWEGQSAAGSVLSHDGSGNPAGYGGCDTLPFAPQVAARPSTDRAESASGLAFEVDFDQAGLTSSNAGARAQSALKEAVVTLPAGMTVDPSVAEGLGVCDPGQLAAATLSAQGCPDASKIGQIEVDTPLLEATLHGSVYLAAQDDPATPTPGAENPFDSLIALYIVIKDPGLGVLLKLPAKVEPDPATGQLITTVPDLPQIPFSHALFRFREGQRAPLITPPTCGEHTASARLYPWARPADPVTVEAGFTLRAGPGGGPCPPGGAPPFAPGFQAGTQNNAAATYSPFEMRITRRDGDQDLTRLSAALPEGLVGRLAGLARCPDAAIALAAAKSGRAELASPSCSEDSRIGSTLAGAGVGEALTYVGGSLYLAGPYHGAPLSVLAITPAVAGPFDAGTVVVRFALRIDPRSARVTVDGAASDPIPHILKGIPLKLRDLRAYADRPGFTLNPTSCDPSQIAATLWGSGPSFLDPADDAPLGRTARFQAAGCSRLGFAPRLALRLRGGTRRGAFPALRLIYRPRAGQADLRRLALRFPRSEFIEQGHFRTICTRVQFNAGPGNGARCPSGAVYGHARVWTPLLDGPAEGPVFLRSSDHNLPDVVLALKGPTGLPIDFEVPARIDSVHGGLRAIANNAPDVPVSRALIDMRGGQKGLLVNSRNLCSSRNRANAVLEGQNGARRRLGPLLRDRCKRARRRHARRSGRLRHSAR
jgi:hypothetical protein